MVTSQSKTVARNTLELVGIAILALVLLRASALLISVEPLTEAFATPIENGITTFLVLGGLGVLYLSIKFDSITDFLPLERLTLDHLYLLWKLLLITWVLAGITSLFLLFVDGGATGNTNAEYTQQSLMTVAASTLISVLIIGPLEEFFYRGVIQTQFQRVVSPQTAIISASAIFTLSHIMTVQGTPLGQVLYYGLLFSVGIVHGYAYWKTNTIYAPMLLHGLYNASIAVLAFL